MAALFSNVFGENLLTEEVVLCNPKMAPSPNDLKHKIIIKHKKIRKDETTIENDDCKLILYKFIENM